MKIESDGFAAEFDQVADRYEEEHAASIRLSGEETTFFARYKVDDVKRIMDRGGDMPQTILDFGAGIGNSTSHFIKAFPKARIVCADVSEKSLEICAERHGSRAEYVTINKNTIDLPDNSVDVIFAACVFHHIEPSEHEKVLRELRRLLKHGGSLFLFEHNPWNPLTLHAVASCPFDEGAVLINAPEMKRRIVKAGFANAETAFRMFFPGFAAKLRIFEKYLAWLPMGAQYRLHAHG